MRAPTTTTTTMATVLPSALRRRLFASVTLSPIDSRYSATKGFLRLAFHESFTATPAVLVLAGVAILSRSRDIPVSFASRRSCYRNVLGGIFSGYYYNASPDSCDVTDLESLVSLTNSRIIHDREVIGRNVIVSLCEHWDTRRSTCSTCTRNIDWVSWCNGIKTIVCVSLLNFFIKFIRCFIYCIILSRF